MDAAFLDSVVEREKFKSSDTMNAMVGPNYLAVDGSALLAQIRELRKKKRTFKDRKLDVASFVHNLLLTGFLRELHGSQYKRAVFYFPKGDEKQCDEYLILPNSKTSGALRDIHIKFCGEKLPASTAFNAWVDDKVPNKWKDRFQKSEKGIDLEIACDALKLASSGRIERLFMFTNDSDFIPLFRTLKEFGANISLIHLSEYAKPNEKLLAESDSYDVLPMGILELMFLPVPVVPAGE